MATTPRNIRFDDDLYKEIKAISKRPLTAAYHIQEACRQYLASKTQPVKSDNPKKPSGLIDDSEFEQVWELYGKKGNRKTAKLRFGKLSDSVKQDIYNHLPAYLNSTPDKQYRKGFEVYINKECWNDEVIPYAENNRPNQVGRPSAVDRVRIAGEKREAERQAREGMGSVVAETVGNIRPPACQSIRGDNTGELGEIIDGHFTTADS